MTTMSASPPPDSRTKRSRMRRSFSLFSAPPIGTIQPRFSPGGTRLGIRHRLLINAAGARPPAPEGITADGAAGRRRFRRSSRQTADAVDEPLDLVRGGVRRAAGAHESVALVAQHPRNRGRVEVAVRDEDAAPGERARDAAGIDSAERERNGGSALAARRHPVELDTGNRFEPLP